MGEQDRLVKPGLATLYLARPHLTRHGHPRQGHHPVQFLRGKGQGHQTGAGFDQGQAKGFRQPISKTRRPHLGDGFAARRHDQAGSADHAACGVHLVSSRTAPHLAHRTAQPQRPARPRQIGGQHRHDLRGRPVAKQLTQRLFMPGNARLIDAGDEIPLGVPFQRRQGKARIGGYEPIRRHAQIGEITAPTTRNADLFARCLGVIHDHNPPPAPRRLDRGVKPRRPGPQNDDIKFLHAPS